MEPHQNYEDFARRENLPNPPNSSEPGDSINTRLDFSQVLGHSDENKQLPNLKPDLKAIDMTNNEDIKNIKEVIAALLNKLEDLNKGKDVSPDDKDAYSKALTQLISLGGGKMGTALSLPGVKKNDLLLSIVKIIEPMSHSQKRPLILLIRKSISPKGDIDNYAILNSSLMGLNMALGFDETQIKAKVNNLINNQVPVPIIQYIASKIPLQFRDNFFKELIENLEIMGIQFSPQIEDKKLFQEILDIELKSTSIDDLDKISKLIIYFEGQPKTEKTEILLERLDKVQNDLMTLDQRKDKLK